MIRTAQFLAGTLPLLFFSMATAQQTDTQNSRLSAAGIFQVSFSSRLQPMTINRMHSWVLHVETAAGDPVEGAEIQVGGGMPEHDHGLPTRPRVTRELGAGDYLVEGMKFHMHGTWQVSFAISTEEATDNVLFDVEL
jgi:hypothetical protein